MTLKLTPAVLRGAYDYLNATDPFCRWNLPDGEDVLFKVVKSPLDRGWYKRPREIAISSRCIGRSQSLIETMAHEMIHLHEFNAQACNASEHSAAFNKWAKEVCDVHGFDHKLF